jgi:hypothetical protein
MQVHGSERSRLLKLAALLLLAAQLVAVCLAPLAEGRAFVDFPNHIEAPGAPPHAGHHSGVCAFCVLRHFSPLPARPGGVARLVVVHQSIRPEPRLAVVVAGHERRDPARAPPSPLLPLPLSGTI